MVWYFLKAKTNILKINWTTDDPIGQYVDMWLQLTNCNKTTRMGNMRVVGCDSCLGWEAKRMGPGKRRDNKICGLSSKEDPPNLRTMRKTVHSPQSTERNWLVSALFVLFPSAKFYLSLGRPSPVPRIPP